MHACAVFPLEFSMSDALVSFCSADSLFTGC